MFWDADESDQWLVACADALYLEVRLVAVFFEEALASHYSKGVRVGEKDCEAESSFYLLYIFVSSVLFSDVDWLLGKGFNFM